MIGVFGQLTSTMGIVSLFLSNHNLLDGEVMGARGIIAGRVPV